MACTHFADGDDGSGAFGADAADVSFTGTSAAGLRGVCAPNGTDNTDVIAAPSTNNLLNIPASLSGARVENRLDERQILAQVAWTAALTEIRN